MCKSIAAETKQYREIILLETNKFDCYTSLFIGIGNLQRRIELWGELHERGIFPVLSGGVCLGTAKAGTLIGRQAIVQVGTVIGVNCIINTGAIVEHDCRIGDQTIISPGAMVMGDCNIGQRVQIGPGAVICRGIWICDDTIIGAGAVVTKDITEKGTYYGVPARAV